MNMYRTNLMADETCPVWAAVIASCPFSVSQGICSKVASLYDKQGIFGLE